MLWIRQIRQSFPPPLFYTIRCLVIFIPQNIWEQQLIHLRGWNFGYHKTYRFRPKLMLQLEKARLSYWCQFQISRWILRWKYSKVFMWNPWNVLIRMHRRKNKTFCTSTGRDDQVATSAKLLDITYESYGFSSDLIETIN